MKDGLPYQIQPMSAADIAEVLEIDKASFVTPWSARAYEEELRQNRLAHYLVARWGTAAPGERKGPIVGYVGVWLIVAEAHITTLAVAPDWRRRGLGEALLQAAIALAVQHGAGTLTLEVGERNEAAQALYRKYGLQVVGRRTGYYRESGEDALIMTVEGINAPAYQGRLVALRHELEERLTIQQPS